MPDIPPSLGELLRRTDPDRLVDVAAAHVRSPYPGCHLEVLLADYRTSGLWPVLRETHTAEGSAAPGDLPAFGERGLLAAVRETRLQPASEAVGSVMRGLHQYHDGHDLSDDAVVVCLDWHGPARDAR